MKINKLILFLILVASFSCTNSKKGTYQVGQILTSKDEILFSFYDETPGHKASFIKLANENYWDSLTFNRVIENFVIQGGCPDTALMFWMPLPPSKQIPMIHH